MKRKISTGRKGVLNEGLMILKPNGILSYEFTFAFETPVSMKTTHFRFAKLSNLRSKSSN
jgi:hypothetical protein